MYEIAEAIDDAVGTFLRKKNFYIYGAPVDYKAVVVSTHSRKIMDTEVIKNVAEMCHEVNKAICEAFGDMSQKAWGEAEQWQRESAIKGVEFTLANPNATSEDQHNAWCKDKFDNGWSTGDVKNPEKKTHPCLVSYSELPPEQRVKDATFMAIVKVAVRQLENER